MDVCRKFRFEKKKNNAKDDDVVDDKFLQKKNIYHVDMYLLPMGLLYKYTFHIHVWCVIKLKWSQITNALCE